MNSIMTILSKRYSSFVGTAATLNYRRKLFYEVIQLKMEQLIDRLVLAIILVGAGMFYESLDFTDIEEESIINDFPTDIEVPKSNRVLYYIIGGVVVIGII